MQKNRPWNKQLSENIQSLVESGIVLHFFKNYQTNVISEQELDSLSRTKEALAGKVSAFTLQHVTLAFGVLSTGMVLAGMALFGERFIKVWKRRKPSGKALKPMK